MPPDDPRLDDEERPRDDRERPRDDGPTEMVEADGGELVERLSGGTATLLLVWLIGVGALSTLLTAWLFVYLVSGFRMGPGQLFGTVGFYIGLAGAAGPCVLWLAGRAQGRSLGWFVLTAIKIALVMLGMFAVVILGTALIMGGLVPQLPVLGVFGLMVLAALPLSAIWGGATWAADRWIARARTDEG